MDNSIETTKFIFGKLYVKFKDEDKGKFFDYLDLIKPDGVEYRNHHFGIGITL